jgi:hypothetical protein
VPLHHQLVDQWAPSQVRYVRLELHEDGSHDWPHSRSYGIWSSFLHLPALRELQFLVRITASKARDLGGDWDTTTFCAKTIRNVIAAVPRCVSLVVAKEPELDEFIVEGPSGRFATIDEVIDLFAQFEEIRGSDAEIWKNDMECMGQLCLVHASGEHDHTNSDDKVARRN